MAFLAAPLVPKSNTSQLLIALARTAFKASRYCLSFTAAGLRPELAAVIASIHLQEGDWARTRAAVLERNALQTRSASTAKRLESELRQRLQGLKPSQLELLAKGTSDDRSAMAWLAVFKRIEIAAELTREVLTAKLTSPDPVLRRSDMAAFYEATERLHPELTALAPTSQQKIRSALLQMLRDAGLLAGKAGKGGTLGTVQRPFLSPQVQERLLEDDPALLAGFLFQPPARSAATSKATSGKTRPNSNSLAKPGPKPGPKPVAKPVAKKGTTSRRATP